MGFWIFMLAMSLFIPLFMLGMGKVSVSHPPREINMFYGYRTRRSMASQEAWDFAQRYYGKLWQRLGIGMLPLSVLPFCFVFGKSEEVVGSVGAVVELIQVVVLLLAIIPTERALKNRFG